MATLTKPQVAMLTRGMRDSVPVAGAKYKTASALVARGFGTVRYELFSPTPEGLRALRDYRSTRYAYSGCIAYLDDLKEVEAALAGLATV